ncbi:hypothetical protein RhiirA5_412439 [Rhizophagus irregularis]|uniref:Uncharacterized protein n=2 Tax=Rhizophagus irregularis TaxID=588596 RepID=A0A2I1E4J0_9GLOM|nr:hypothetical protein RhiirA5_412438 [Rhizophagus irregularis]PKC11950.1 hypothetical protein RhiirA5_412439 [Rhizophagus irregularis]PKY17043.1 hypothetical protein RhiirB3_429568 [Rhizophagus irregularis]
MTTLKALANLTQKVPVFRFKGSMSYKNKKLNEVIKKLHISNNINARFIKDEDNTSRLFFVNNKEENLKLNNLVVLNSTNNTFVEGKPYPTETGPYSYKICQDKDYKIFHNSIPIIRLHSQCQQAISMYIYGGKLTLEEHDIPDIFKILVTTN